MTNIEEYVFSDVEICGVISWIKTQPNGIQASSEAGIVTKDKWGKLYRKVGFKGKTMFPHNLAWLLVNGSLPDGVIDHINGESLDNSLANLRVVTPHENNKNKRHHKNNTSGITGVSWHTRDHVWCPRIRVDGLLINLKSTADFFEACCTRKSAENKYKFHENHGKAARLDEE
jgi:hypothetical protein